MNINQFKEGDLITRALPVNGDRSYIGDELEFIGVESGIIMLVGNPFGDEYIPIKLRINWFGEGWDYFPKSLWEKTVFRAKQKAKSLCRTKES